MSLVFSIARPNASQLPKIPDDAISLRGSLAKTVILIHGLTGTPNEVRHLATILHKAGYSVVCPRLAKHGEPLDILKRASWEEFYETVKQVFLRESESGNSIYVAGLSMSALFVLLLAAEFPEKLSGGVCLAPTLFFDGWNVPWYTRLLPLASYTPLKYVFYFKESPPYGLKNERMRSMVHRYYSRAKLNDIEEISKFGYAYFPVSLIYQLRRLAKKATSIMGAVRIPLLLIHPEEDDTASLKNSEIIYNGVSSLNKKLIVLNDSYHVITADQEREKVAREVQKFIDSI